jgi:hypothetical protein
MVKNCTSRWSFAKNHNMMHGQQNVKLFKILYHHIRYNEIRHRLLKNYHSSVLGVLALRLHDFLYRP